MSKTFKNPFKFDNYTRMSGGDSPFVLDFKSRARPIHSNQELPVFSVEGGWGADNQWQNTGVTFNLKDEKSFNPTKRVKVVRGNKLGWGLKKQEPIGVHLERQHWDDQGNMLDSTYVYMNKDTLKKGTQTILGMNEQVDQDGYLVRGNNYANPWYPSDKSIKENKQAKTNRIEEIMGNLPPALTVDMKKDIATAMQEKEYQSKGSGGPSTKHPDAEDPDGDGQGNYAFGGQSNYGSGGTGPQAKGAKRAARIRAFDENYKYIPGVQQANALLSDWGRGPIKPVHRRIGYGNRRTNELSLDPKKFIEKYYETEGLIEWAKGINPEHAKLDPNRKITVVDVKSGYSKPTYWRHQGSVYHTGSQYIDTSTYKDVLVSSPESKLTKGDKKEMLYKKIMDKSRSNKSKYSKYYKTDPQFQDYSYYAVSDKDFDDYEEYKQNLITNISSRRQNQEGIIGEIESDFKTITKKDRQKSLIPTLEEVHTELDTKATTLKNQVGDYDWQKKISQSTFGTDKVPGHSHVGFVLDSYDGEVRGGAYYSGDVGKLIKKTKAYESEVESQIAKQTKDIEDIKLDKSDSLVEFYNEKQDKEYAISSRDYLEKSLKLTREERKKLEQEKKEQDYYVLRSNAGNVSLNRSTQSRGRPSLKSFSRQGGGGGSKRTRSGNEFTLGGIVT